MTHIYEDINKILLLLEFNEASQNVYNNEEAVKYLDSKNHINNIDLTILRDLLESMYPYYELKCCFGYNYYYKILKKIKEAKELPYNKDFNNNYKINGQQITWPKELLLELYDIINNKCKDIRYIDTFEITCPDPSRDSGRDNELIYKLLDTMGHSYKRGSDTIITLIDKLYKYIDVPNNVINITLDYIKNYNTNNKQYIKYIYELQRSIELNDIPKFQNLIFNYSDYDISDINNIYFSKDCYNIVHLASKYSINILKILVNEYDININKNCPYINKNSLEIAIQYKNKDTIEYLISLGFDINYLDSSRDSGRDYGLPKYIISILQTNDVEFIEYMICRYKINIYQKYYNENEYINIFHISIYESEYNVIEYLISKRISSLDIRKNINLMPIRFCILNDEQVYGKPNYFNTLKTLLKYYIINKINIFNILNGHSKDDLITLAIKNNRINSFKLFNSISWDTINLKYLELAIEFKRVEIIELILPSFLNYSINYNLESVKKYNKIIKDINESFHPIN